MNTLEIIILSIKHNYAFILSIIVMYEALVVFLKNFTIKANNYPVYIYCVLSIIYSFFYQYATSKWELDNLTESIGSSSNQLWTMIESLIFINILYILILIYLF